jgi:hypothetical protein
MSARAQQTQQQQGQQQQEKEQQAQRQPGWLVPLSFLDLKFACLF